MYERVASIVVIALAIVGVVLLVRNSELFNLTCVPSSVDGRTYCVRSRTDTGAAADLLAHTTGAMTELVATCGRKHQGDPRIRRLVKRYKPNVVRETTRYSEHTAYSENKGEKLAFCVNRRNAHNNTLVDQNTLTFVAVHELAHVMTLSTGHTPEFWDNFKFLLHEAVDAGLYMPVDYSKEPAEYCSMPLTDSPLFA
jgi:hypothetical protein